MFILQAFGHSIREARIRRRWSQERLAEYAQLDRSYMSAIERGQRNPSVLTALRISRALGMSLSALLLENGRHVPPTSGSIRDDGRRPAETQRTVKAAFSLSIRSEAEPCEVGSRAPDVTRQIVALDAVRHLLQSFGSQS